MNARVGFTTLFVQNKNLMHTSFVIEAYRTVERAHGQPPTKCFAFGSHLHVGHTEDVAKRLGIEVVTTSYGVKNAVTMNVRVAGTLWPHLSDTIVTWDLVIAGLKWFRNLRAEGLRLECVARDHQICKEAQASYDALYRMDTKRMNLPTPTDLRQAVIDCIPQIEVGPVLMEDATGMLRASRIVPRNTPGHILLIDTPTCSIQRMVAAMSDFVRSKEAAQWQQRPPKPRTAQDVARPPRSMAAPAAGVCCARRTPRPSIRRATRLDIQCSAKLTPCVSGTN